MNRYIQKNVKPKSISKHQNRLEKFYDKSIFDTEKNNIVVFEKSKTKMEKYLGNKKNIVVHYYK